MRQLKLDNIQPIMQHLPEGFDKHIKSIDRQKNRLTVIIHSFTGNNEYKVRVERTNDGALQAHCSCKAWATLKGAEQPPDPCKHIAAALACEPHFIPATVYQDSPKKEPQIETKTTSEPDPFLDPVPDASPTTRSNAIVEKQTRSLVTPIATIEETLASFRAFQDAKKALLDPTDFQKVYNGRYIKKSGWRKVAVFFGLSLQKIDEGLVKGQSNHTWMVTYRATAPGGQYQEATGYCSWDEQMGAGRVLTAKKTAANNQKSGKWDQDKAEQYVLSETAKLEHDIRATAETRAKNRAISDLVGGGEVSAEEMKRSS